VLEVINTDRTTTSDGNLSLCKLGHKEDTDLFNSSWQFLPRTSCLLLDRRFHGWWSYVITE